MKKYIYESPDKGKTVYRREFNDDKREMYKDGKWYKEVKWWNEVKEA